MLQMRIFFIEKFFNLVRLMSSINLSQVQGGLGTESLIRLSPYESDSQGTLPVESETRTTFKSSSSRYEL